MKSYFELHRKLHLQFSKYVLHILYFDRNYYFPNFFAHVLNIIFCRHILIYKNKIEAFK